MHQAIRSVHRHAQFMNEEKINDDDDEDDYFMLDIDSNINMSMSSEMQVLFH